MASEVRDGDATMKRNVTKSVLCPFYQSDERQIIYCEGVEPDTRIHLAFSSSPQLVCYRKRFCEREYRRCRIADMLLRKWEEDE